MRIGGPVSLPVTQPAKKPVAPAPAMPAPPSVKAQSLADDPLPAKFSDPDQYKHYAVRLVSEAIVAQSDLARAQKAFVNGEGSPADVNRAATAANKVRDRIREMQSKPSGFQAFIWSFKGFGGGARAAFWQAQGLDLSSQNVRPKATDLIATISGPTAEALKAAVAAIDRGEWEQAQHSFNRAAEVAGSQKEALVTGRVAAGLRFDVSADNAFRRAVELAKDPGEAAEVGTEAAAFTNYTYRSADFAFRKAADLSKTKDQALKVADQASAAGKADAANYASQRASELK